MLGTMRFGFNNTDRLEFVQGTLQTFMIRFKSNLDISYRLGGERTLENVRAIRN